MTDPRLKDMLSSAWRENRLAALHVDVQVEYEKTRSCLPAFVSTRMAARMLRTRCVPNIWVAYIDAARYNGPRVTTAGAYKAQCRTDGKSALRLSEIAGADDFETVSCKIDPSAFNYSSLDSHLRGLGVDTLIIGGVYAWHCVALTARGALSRGFNVVVNTDAIDSPPRDRAFLKERIQGPRLDTASMAKRFAFAPTGDITACLT